MRQSTKDTFARVASVYRNALADGRSPVDAVAVALGITYTAAKDRIYRARRAGVLKSLGD